jgi:membrane protease subunit HflC
LKYSKFFQRDEEGVYFLKDDHSLVVRGRLCLNFGNVCTFGGGRVISEANRIGIDDFIEKPFTAKTIEEFLSRLLEKQEEKSKAKDAHEQAKRFGIKIIDVRIKRADLPKEVQASVYARMQAERHRIAKRYRAEGEQRSREIKAETDKEKEIILAKAYQQQMKLFGEGDGRATEIFASSYEQDMEFYSFLRRLQSYEKLFEGKTTILLEADSELLKYFRSPRVPSK